MWRKALGVLLLAGALMAGEFFKMTPAKKSTGKSDLIPLKSVKAKVQTIWNNPVIAKWGNGLGAALVLGPADTPLIDWGGVLGYTGDIVYGAWNNYDPNNTAYILSGIDALDTFAAFFQSPAACTVVAFGVYVYNMTTDPTADFDFFAAWSAPGVDPHPENPWGLGSGTYPDTMGSGLGWYLDYHYGYDYPGPSPFYDKNWITAPVTQTGPPSDSLIHAYVFYPDAGVIDNAANAPFWIGWAPLTFSSAVGNAEPWVLIDASYGQGDWHCWIYQQDLSGFGVSPGWYNQWHGYWMDAFVWVYEDPAPVIVSTDQLPWTFSTGPFTIQSHIKDILGIPASNQGVEACTLEVYASPSSPTPQKIAGTLVSGDSTDGYWEFTFGPFSVGDTVRYRVYKAVDFSGNVTSETVYKEFVITAPAPTDSILFVDEDHDAWAAYAYDILNYLLDFTDGNPGDGNPSAFFWDAATMGYPDASVLDASRFKAIFWTAWGPTVFAYDTVNIKNYLDAGGALFISSQDLVTGGFGLGDWTVEVNFPTDYPNHFARTYLKIGRSLDDVVGGLIPKSDTVVAFYGFPTDPISDPAPTYWAPMDSVLYYGFEGSNYAGYVYPDDENNAVFDTLFPCWFYEPNVPDRQSGTPTAYWYDGPNYGDPYKLVLFYWNYQYLVDSVSYDGSGNVIYYVFDKWRVNELTKRILDFFGMTVNVKEMSKVRPSDLRLSLRAPSIAGLGKVTILYTLPSAGNVKIGLYDASGRFIKDIFQGRKKAGAYAVSFSTGELRAGTYFVKLEFGNKSRTQKLVFVK